MKNNKQISRVLEIFWLSIFILTFILGIYNIVQKGFSEYMFLIMSGLAFLMFKARQNLRKKNEKE